jgi:hypothetical protein
MSWFGFPGRSFNAGQFVGTSGILSRRDFTPFVRFGVSPERIQPEVFGQASRAFSTTCF